MGLPEQVKIIRKTCHENYVSLGGQVEILVEHNGFSKHLEDSEGKINLGHSAKCQI